MSAENSIQMKIALRGKLGYECGIGMPLASGRRLRLANSLRQKKLCRYSKKLIQTFRRSTMIKLLKPNAPEVVLSDVLSLALLHRETESDGFGDLEIVKLARDTVLAYAKSSFTKRRHLNVEATRMLQAKTKVSIKVYGPAVTFTQADVPVEKDETANA
jgi:hypothetical protein